MTEYNEVSYPGHRASPPDQTPPPARYGSPAPVGPPRRPVVLTVALVSAILVAVLDIVASIMVIATGKSAVADDAKRILGDTIKILTPSEQQALLDKAYQTLVTKAIIALVPAAIILVFALLSFGGALWARIVLAIVAVGSICGTAPTIAETAVSTGITAMELLAVLLVLVTVVLLFLPPVNRYARGRRAVR
jgi:hypothetical protein